MSESDSIRKTAILLVLAGLLWNIFEAAVALWAGIAAGSVAILAFGLDSIIELLACVVLLWRLRLRQDDSEAEFAEVKARRLLGFGFLLLAAYVVLHSGASLTGWLPEPQPSLAGTGIVVASAVVMTGLYVGKMRIAVLMQSRSLRAEAMESLFCDLQDLTILIGLVLNSLFSWWWADPVSALILVPLFLREGVENLSGEEEDSEGGAPRVCFCGGCVFGVRECKSACCAA